jgi:site-specific DNA recombinase
MAAYCRVSTEQDDQLHSFAAQVEYYTKYINEHENYELADIYADEGISGTNTKKRAEFNRMIADCEAGKVDMIITKSISRFARNTQDCLMFSRKLKNLGIGILFEKENINTLDSTGELLFTILSSLAQDESRNISENCKWGIRTKFKNGEMHLNTVKFLGYDKDENGKLVINPKEAKTVKRIYEEFLWGRSPQEIAARLEEEKVPGCLGQTKWYSSTVLNILQNEKHMGDALLQKTYTADFLTKRQVKNQGEITQVYVKDNHKGIISKETWNAVQEELERRKAFRNSHGVKNYSFGGENNPFTNKVYCGLCGEPYRVHTWKNRGIKQWKCKNHRIDGKLVCKADFVEDDELKKGFIKAFNIMVTERIRYMDAWEKMKSEGSPLQRIRAGQLIAVTDEPPIQKFVPELAQLVITEVTILGAKKFKFEFMDGSVIKI